MGGPYALSSFLLTLCELREKSRRQASGREVEGLDMGEAGIVAYFWVLSIGGLVGLSA